MVSVVTKNGKNAIIKRGFSNESSFFSYMAVGVGASIPTEDSVGLSSECTAQTHGNYSRVILTTTFEESTKRAIATATFIKDSEGQTDGNIRNQTTLTEIGITDTSNLQQNGNFWCICQIPETPKNNAIELKFTIVTTAV
ncbi:MAG: hypothetical protein Q8M92_03785 [Candidatus Subteraquimicrobiales bacterium]|nr:hypothetical protein [Candidatus Subteraquimicrobiales bacterium]